MHLAVSVAYTDAELFSLSSEQVAALFYSVPFPTRELALQSQSHTTTWNKY